MNNTKTVIVKHPFVDRVYVTKGDNGYNQYNHKCDKCVGLEIKGKIYWLNTEFAYPRELGSILSPLAITVCDQMQWGVWMDGTAMMDKRLTRISWHHDDIFTTGSYYTNKSQRKPDDYLFWSVDEILDIFDPDRKLATWIYKEEGHELDFA